MLEGRSILSVCQFNFHMWEWFPRWVLHKMVNEGTQVLHFTLCAMGSWCEKGSLICHSVCLGWTEPRKSDCSSHVWPPLTVQRLVSFALGWKLGDLFSGWNSSNTGNSTTSYKPRCMWMALVLLQSDFVCGWSAWKAKTIRFQPHSEAWRRALPPPLQLQVQYRSEIFGSLSETRSLLVRDWEVEVQC